MTNAEDLALQFAEAVSQGHIEPLEDQRAKIIGVLAWLQQHRGQRVAVLSRIEAQQLQSPRLNGATRGLRMTAVTGENVVQALLRQHLERFVESVEQVGRRRVGKEPRLVRG